MLKFHHAPQSRSLIVHWMLEELGESYEIELLNLKTGEHKKPAYLAVNPMGKVPALEHDGVVLTEAAAICCYLADTFPKAALAPAIGDPARGPYLKWLFFGPSCLEPAVIDRMSERSMPPYRRLGYGDFDTMLGVVVGGVSPGPWLLGDRFTAADVVIGSGVAWGIGTKAVPERPELVAYVDRMMKRPALRRVYAKDAEFVAAQAGERT